MIRTRPHGVRGRGHRTHVPLTAGARATTAKPSTHTRTAKDWTCWWRVKLPPLQDPAQTRIPHTQEEAQTAWEDGNSTNNQRKRVDGTYHECGEHTHTCALADTATTGFGAAANAANHYAPNATSALTVFATHADTGHLPTDRHATTVHCSPCGYLYRTMRLPSSNAMPIAQASRSSYRRMSWRSWATACAFSSEVMLWSRAKLFDGVVQCAS